MEKQIIDDQEFEKFQLIDGCSYEFNGCTFKNCDFSKASFKQSEFIECRFESCDLSMVQMDGTALNRVSFLRCKVMGVDFSKCSKFLFAVSFDECLLNFSVFHKNDLRNSTFKNSILKEVTFVEVNLTSVKFINCDLENTVFDRSNLEKSDFTTARNYSFDPEINRMKKARFSMPDVVRLLSKYDILISEN